jgi:Ferredoxin-like domain in Api92-like protein
MPNWIYNNLRIDGPKESVKRIMDQMSNPLKDCKDDIVFSFFNIVSPTDNEDYNKNWYDWNIQNWGVKWDINQSEINLEGPFEFDDNMIVSYSFNTPWECPYKAIKRLSEQYPDVIFSLEYESGSESEVYEFFEGGLKIEV